MVIFEGVTLIYLYNVPLRPHGVYCQHEPQWGDIFYDEAFIWDILLNFTFFVCAGSKISESCFFKLCQESLTDSFTQQYVRSCRIL